MSNDNPNFINDHNANPSENSDNQMKVIYQQSSNNMDNNKCERNIRKCGWFCLTPDCFQNFRTPKWVLFWLCWAGALQGMVVNGLVNIVITTIEKRFGMNSFQSGLIAGGYDVASFICLIPVTYFGGCKTASKPRWLGFGVIVMGIGSLVFASPHILYGKYKNMDAVINTCNHFENSSIIQDKCNQDDINKNVKDSTAMWLFFLGQLLHGAGATPLFTLGVTYIDENVSKKMSSVYIGIYYATAIIGPALGYVLGGQMLELYTDFLTVKPSDFGLKSTSNTWIGAWWLGFILSALLSITIAIPLLAFPPELPNAEKYRLERESEAHASTATTTVFTKFKEMPKAFRALILNPTFFFLNIAGATEGLIIAGFSAFLPKVIENQFSVNAANSSIIMGLVTIPSGGGGTYLGGYLVKKLKLKCPEIIKLCIYFTIFAIIFSINLIITCNNLPYAGVNIQFHNDSSEERYFNLNSDCNSKCDCNEYKFDPVCGEDNVMYFSPCYAGCTEEYTIGDSKLYANCSCIIKQDEYKPYDATNSMCTSKCDKMWLFVLLSFGSFLFTFLSTMPALTATLRCVRENQRSFALGIQWIKVRLLGTIPAPIIFGFLIDKSCVLWQNSCSGYGACRLYDNDYMSKYMLGLAFVGKGCSVLFFFLAWWFYIPPKQTN